MTIKEQLQEISEIATIDVSDGYDVKVRIRTGISWIAKSRETKEYIIKSKILSPVLKHHSDYDFTYQKHIRKYYPYYHIEIKIHSHSFYTKQSIVEKVGEEVIEKLNLLLTDVIDFRIDNSYTNFYSRTLTIDFMLINDTEVLTAPKRTK